MLDTAIGSAAAVFTTLSYVPQVRKTWSTGHAGDLSLKMLLLLAAGLTLWLAYGAIKEDWVVMIANASSLSLVSAVLLVKLRGRSGTGT